MAHDMDAEAEIAIAKQEQSGVGGSLPSKPKTPGKRNPIRRSKPSILSTYEKRILPTCRCGYRKGTYVETQIMCSYRLMTLVPHLSKAFGNFLWRFFRKKRPSVILNTLNPHYMGRMRCSECACRYDAKHDPPNWCGFCGDYTHATISWW